MKFTLIEARQVGWWYNPNSEDFPPVSIRINSNAGSVETQWVAELHSKRVTGPTPRSAFESLFDQPEEADPNCYNILIYLPSSRYRTNYNQ